jgi:hypothetical protein
MSHLIPNLKCHIEEYPPCIFREMIAMKTYHISGVELDRLKILSDVLNGKLTLKEASHALHLR